MKFKEDSHFRAAFLRREPQAVNEFVGHFVTVLGKIGQTKGLSLEEAEDTVQECFGVFFRKISEIQSDVKFSTFLFGVFFNCINETRRSRGRLESFGDLGSVEHLISQNYDQKGHWKTGVAPKPLDTLLMVEGDQQLQDCLKQLPDRHKDVILLTLQQDEDPKELCHILGVSYANFRQLLTRGRQALRLCLENYVGEN